jgi:hypothetical protein
LHLVFCCIDCKLGACNLMHFPAIDTTKNESPPDKASAPFFLLVEN